jgi:predicted Rossmann-fold nucleotide-binding protein
VGIPTYLYGHEPTTPFATYVAKYFDNSIREDILLNISRGGLIFTPGSAGTLQEIFQAAVPNHYETFGYGSPMVFLGTEFWKKEVPVYRLVEHLVKTGKYSDLLISITDDIEEIVQTIKAFRPKTKSEQ